MPVVSFRVTAEVHESLIKLAETRNQTLTALMQETTSHIVERTQPLPVVHVVDVTLDDRGQGIFTGGPITVLPGENIAVRVSEAHPKASTSTFVRPPYGSRLKKDKGSK